MYAIPYFAQKISKVQLFKRDKVKYSLSKLFFVLFGHKTPVSCKKSIFKIAIVLIGFLIIL